MKIAGKLALITGASSGIGAAAARAIARRGGRVLLVARTRPALEQVAAAITACGGVAAVYPADVSDAADVDRLARAIEGEVGTPDILINNAGAGRWLFVEDTDPAEAVQAMAVPYFAAFYVTRAFMPEMLRRNSGHIVNITSPICYMAWPGATAYGVARWAMRGFTAALRAELYGTGIGVTLMTPTKVSSPYFANNPGSEERIPWIARLYGTLTPEQVGEAIVQAVEHNRREVIMPFTLRLTVMLHNVLPRPIDWLLVRTGWNRSRQARRRVYEAVAGESLENPITGERILFCTTARESNGARVVIDHFLKPHTSTFPEHVQLNQAERFEIISGTACYSINGVKRCARAGDVIMMPPGTPHRNPWNESDAELHFRHETSPDYGSEHFFATLFRLAQDGKTDKHGAVSLLRLAAIGDELASQTYVTGMPIAVQRALFPLLGAIGRRLGYRAHYP
jgi:short-subunit dehydrogenase/mannose-6-phosphate isomerase-like protein (cupin superfamily)